MKNKKAIKNIPICSILIEPSIYEYKNDASFKALANDIRQNGLLKEILVYKPLFSKKYIIIDGVRRIKALTYNNETMVKAKILKGISKKQADKLKIEMNMI